MPPRSLATVARHRMVFRSRKACLVCEIALTRSQTQGRYRGRAGKAQGRAKAPPATRLSIDVDATWGRLRLGAGRPAEIRMKQSLPHVAGGSADTIEPAVSSFLQPPMTSCRPHPAGAVQVSGAVQPPTEKPRLDPGSLAGPGSLMPSDGKRPSHHPALPADRSSRPRSVRGDGRTMRAISRRGTRWTDCVLVSTPPSLPPHKGECSLRTVSDAQGLAVAELGRR